MRLCRVALLCLILANVAVCSFGQHQQQLDSIIHIPSGFKDAVNKKISHLDDELTHQSNKYISKLARQEELILKRLSEVDSSASVQMLNNSKQVYNNLSQKIKSVTGKATKGISGQYLANLDSLQASLKFLQQAKNIAAKSKNIHQDLGNSLEGLAQLQNKLDEAGNVRQVLQQRQQWLKELLNRHSNLPKDLTKKLGKYQQDLFYYGRNIQEYKTTLNDPDKLFKKVLGALRNLPAFSQFMDKHSFLSDLMGTNISPGQAPTIDPGLPTRAQAMQVVQQRIGAAGPGGQQIFSQQLQEAQSQLKKLKEKFNNAGISSDGNLDIPDFKPNSLKSKSFLKRVELGTNIQSQRATNYFPITSDFALTAGYRLSPSKIIGVGIAGRIGWGESWRKINVTGEGVGLRFFIDLRARGNFWLTGGAELNYRKTINALTDFKNYSNWNESALIGISRKYKVSKKLSGNIQLLYDFMHSRNIPRTTPVIWRVGYNF